MNKEQEEATDSLFEEGVFIRPIEDPIYEWAVNERAKVLRLTRENGELKERLGKIHRIAERETLNYQGDYYAYGGVARMNLSTIVALASLQNREVGR